MSTGNELVTLKQVDGYYKDLRKRSAPVILNSAVGNPAVFSDGADGLPIQSLEVHLLPRQEGDGDPSPENIRSIVPWNGVDIFGGGKNLLKLAESEMISIGWNRFFPNPINKAGTYTISCKYPFGGTGNQGARAVLTNVAESNPQEIKLLTGWTFGQSENVNKATFTLTEEEAKCTYILFECSGARTGFNQFENAKMQIESGSSATAYEPYKPIIETDIEFSSPVYGGTLDVVSGVMTATYSLLTKNTAEMNNNEDYPGWKNSGVENIIGTGVNALISNVLTNVSPVSGLSVGANTAYGSDVLYLSKSYFNKTQSEWKALAIDIQILVPLVIPVEVQLTPAQLQTFLGNNTIWSDANGDIEVEYRADTELFLKQNTVKDVKVNGTSVLNDGVANVPIASTTNAGVAKVGSGLAISNNALTVNMANADAVKAGVQAAAFLRPIHQHVAAFYGLAKAAGVDMAESSNPVGQFTDEAKIAIQKMLGVYEAPWELIREDTFTNDTEAHHEITVDANGEAFALTDVILYFESPVQDTYSSKGMYGQLWFYDNQDTRYEPECGAWTQSAGETATNACGAIIEQKNGMMFVGTLSTITNTNNNNLKYRYIKGFKNGRHGILLRDDQVIINKIVIPKVTGTGHYIIYGKRKWN